MQLKKLQLITANLSILLVEDHKETREATEEFLRIFFHKVFCAENYKNAKMYCAKTQIDILITDLELPDKDGFEIINLFRKNNRNLPVIIFSAYSDKDYLLKSIKYDVDAYIIKPLKMGNFFDAIDKIQTKYNLKNNIRKINRELYWDFQKNSLYKKNKSVNLTKNEKTLIELFMKSPSWYVNFEQMYNAIFIDSSYDKKRVQNVVYRLNKKLSYQLLYSQYGDGYYLNINSFPDKPSTLNM